VGIATTATAAPAVALRVAAPKLTLICRGIVQVATPPVSTGGVGTGAVGTGAVGTGAGASGGSPPSVSEVGRPELRTFWSLLTT